MIKRQKLALAGVSALGAVALLSGCGGSSFSKNSFANYPNTIPYAYGIEPVAFYGRGNAAGNQAAIEGSGLQSADGKTAYLTAASAFAVTAPGAGATAVTPPNDLPPIADPNGTGILPLGFSTNGSYVDAQNRIGLTAAPVTSVAPGTSVVFRAALANGTAADNTSPGISGATLTSTDPAFAAISGLTAGLPMTLNAIGGPFASATYVTGTGGTPAPFTIPAGTPTGLHTFTVTVTDSAGRVTATTFATPVVDSASVGLFLQSFTTTAATTAAAAVLTPIAPGDTVTIDGEAGTGVYPTGFASTKADVDGTVVLFTTPGTHTVTETSPATATAAAAVVQTATFTIPATAAGTTLFNVPVSTVTAASATSAKAAENKARALAIRSHLLHH